MNGRSGLRPEVLSFLCDMLNTGITPLLAKEGGEGPSLAKAVLGAGLCLFKGEVRCAQHSCGMLDFRALRLDYKPKFPIDALSVLYQNCDSS